MKEFLLYLVPLLIFFGCKDSGAEAQNGDDSMETKIDYLAQVDEPADRGQYWSIKSHVVPKRYHVCLMNSPPRLIHLLILFHLFC